MQYFALPPYQRVSGVSSERAFAFFAGGCGAGTAFAFALAARRAACEVFGGIGQLELALRTAKRNRSGSASGADQVPRRRLGVPLGVSFMSPTISLSPQTSLKTRRSCASLDRGGDGGCAPSRGELRGDRGSAPVDSCVNRLSSARGKTGDTRFPGRRPPRILQTRGSRHPTQAASCRIATTPLRKRRGTAGRTTR